MMSVDRRAKRPLGPMPSSGTWCVEPSDDWAEGVLVLDSGGVACAEPDGAVLTGDPADIRALAAFTDSVAVAGRNEGREK
jgi:hypothetical protein